MMTTFSCHSSKQAVSTDETVTEKTAEDSLPHCIKALIKKFASEEKTNPPQKIYSYTYKGKKVYYVPGPCCDNFSDLYDSNCHLLGHPDGGFTGRGDGKFPDFAKEKTNEKLVWADKRK